MIRTIFIYAIALAALAWLLQFIEYQYAVRVLPGNFYIFLIALIFTGLGIWAGLKLTAGRKPAPFEPNQKAIDYLGISERELEVLQLVEKGLSNQNIADRIYVSTNTVKTHLKHIYEKLGVANRTQAVKKARDLRLIG